MSFTNLLPDFDVAMPAAMLSIAAFENQRYVRYAAKKYTTSPVLAVAELLFFHLAGLLSIIFSILFFCAYWYDQSLLEALALIVVKAVASILFAMIIMDHIVVWVIGTVAIYPLMFWLSGKVTWFGFM